MQNSVEMKLITGRIVMYDWVAHEMTNGEDFVVNTEDPGRPYIRVLYRPNWGFDAPASASSSRLDRLAFVGRGAKWTFQLESAHSDEQEAACKAPIKKHRYEDERGKGELDRYVTTPGGKLLNDAAIGGLPCFVLRLKGMSKVSMEQKR